MSARAVGGGGDAVAGQGRGGRLIGGRAGNRSGAGDVTRRRAGRRFGALAAALLLAGCAAAGAPERASPPGAGATLGALPANAVANALPYTLEFVPVTGAAAAGLPALQSYAIATAADGRWLLLGGRRNQGLHMFNPAPAYNFPRDSTNRSLWVIDPATLDVWSLDLRALAPALAAPLMATNPQSYYDAAADLLYVIGGYGWTADQSDMITFPTLTVLPVARVMQAVVQGNADSVAALIRTATDQRFAVTGGELKRIGYDFYLVFGQRFDGQYRAFGPDSVHELPYRQAYTNEIRKFRLNPRDTVSILSYSALTTADPSMPFHRRDGNIFDDVDPATGAPRIAAYGGVFPPGIIGAYTQPVYVDGGGARLETGFSQRFSQYTAPVIVAWDSAGGAAYRTFFGGIGGTYYYQAAGQAWAMDTVTKQGRNDGLPFTADITTVVQSGAGYAEWILPYPVPDTLLLAATVPFIPNVALGGGRVTEGGAIRLNAFAPGDTATIGYIFGGILANCPLPLIPSSGTQASNLLFRVVLRNTPSAAIPASAGTPALPGPRADFDRSAAAPSITPPPRPPRAAGTIPTANDLCPAPT
jgi:hypothetical protein